MIFTNIMGHITNQDENHHHFHHWVIAPNIGENHFPTTAETLTLASHCSHSSASSLLSSLVVAPTHPNLATAPHTPELHDSRMVGIVAEQTLLNPHPS